MSNASLRGTGQRACALFAAAGVCFAISCMGSPMLLVAAFGLVAAGLFFSRCTLDYVAGAALFALLLFAFGYGIGKDLARRDAPPASIEPARH